MAVALALPAVIRGHALRQHKALAAFQACARSAALVEQTKDEPSSWKLLCPEAPPSELAAGAPIDLTAEELAGFAEKLLLLDNLQEKTQVIGCCLHNAVLTGEGSAMFAKDAGCHSGLRSDSLNPADHGTSQCTFTRMVSGTEGSTSDVCTGSAPWSIPE